MKVIVIGGNGMVESIVELENINKSFKGVTVIDDMNLSVNKGEFLTLLGPSGCGKTTTLRMIAGFEKPTNGNIKINGEVVNKVEPNQREINTVFQHYSLFPHMSIFKNIAFGLKMKKVSKKEIKRRVDEVLDMVQLKHLSSRKPEQLSGGQQQRIAIARAIVNNPKVLLLDEPLGALDLKLRKQMQLELKRLQELLEITFIYVTHDQEEALTMSDRIVVLNKGEIEQLDTSRNIYEKPKSLFVADFIGETNILEGVVKSSDEQQLKVELNGKEVNLPPDDNFNKNMKIHMSIRPEKIKYSPESFEHPNVLEASVTDVVYSGSITKLIVKLADEQKLTIQLDNESTIKEGELIHFCWEPEHVSIHISDDEQKITEKEKVSS